MTVRLLSSLVVAALSLTGCRMCASPFDNCGPTADSLNGWGSPRRGSMFSDDYHYGENEVAPQEGDVIVEEGPTNVRPQAPAMPTPRTIRRETSPSERVTTAGIESARRRR